MKSEQYSVDLHSADIISFISRMSFTYSTLNQAIKYLTFIREIIVAILMVRLLIVAKLGYY